MCMCAPVYLCVLLCYRLSINLCLLLALLPTSAVYCACLFVCFVCRAHASRWFD